MIFLDTSAVYAWADTADPNHPIAVRHLQAILESGEELLTHNYVLVESMALLQTRLGLTAAIKLAQDSTAFVIEWVDEDLHTSAVHELERSKKHRISLVDRVSFLVMKRRNLVTAFAFDRDFISAGFRLFEA